MSTEHAIIEYSKRTKTTVTAIAARAECSRMTLYRLMRGEQNATLDLLQRISAATGGQVTLSQLVGETESAA